MKYPEQSITSISELLEKLKKDLDNINLPVWFRGQANKDWKLNPKLMRLPSHNLESHYINKFKQNATIILNHKPTTEFEWLFLMQHYGIPTRLLDWSESPLVAIYFAIVDMIEVGHDGALWILLPTELNKMSNYKPEYESEIPSFEDEHLNNYLPSTISAERKSSMFPLAAIAPRNSPRMQSQLGVFTINHRENIFLDEVGHTKDHFWRYIIPATAKNEILKELKLLSFTKFQLFPELESLSDNLK